LDEAFRLADTLTQEGHDVLMEGYQLSGEVERTVALARAQAERGNPLHVLWLDVPLERCVANVVARRRAGRDALPSIERTVQAGHEALVAAHQALQQAGVDVERLGTDAALHRTLAWLGLERAAPADVSQGPFISLSSERPGRPDIWHIDQQR
jgi:predicted kinase